jgi:uncharacterized protein (TIGR01777 family)
MADSEQPLRVAIAGASGLVGTALTAHLADRGEQVIRLVRHPPHPGANEVYWSPAEGEIDRSALAGVDAVVHLGGENIASGRWTAARKAAIRDSRVVSTRLLSEALARLEPPPQTFVCASATGYYGDRGDAPLTEDSGPGTGFLAEVCQAWEAATAAARQAGLRVVNLRTGMVLSAKGGALAKMLRPFRMGLGGVIGGGRQYVSWIGLDDLVRAIEFLLRAGGVSGPVNTVAPQPVTNREFTRTLGWVLRRPTLLPLPRFMVRALFGEMGQTLLLEGSRVLPAKLARAGFSFLHPRLEEALRAALAVDERPAIGD